jgi:hypothetical protein
LQAEFEFTKAYEMLYGDKVIPPIYGRITRIAAVTEEDWNNTMDASSFIQEFLNAAEKIQSRNEVGHTLQSGSSLPSEQWQRNYYIVT